MDAGKLGAEGRLDPLGDATVSRPVLQGEKSPDLSLVLSGSHGWKNRREKQRRDGDDPVDGQPHLTSFFTSTCTQARVVSEIGSAPTPSHLALAPEPLSLLVAAHTG